jgi:hypothetical protein
MLLEPRPHPVHAHVVGHVFQPCPLAVGAVGGVAVEANRRLGGAQQVVRPDEADRGGEARIGVGPVVRHALAAAEMELVAEQGLALEDRDEGDVVGQHVDRVVARVGDADLALPRHVGGAVEGLGLAAGLLARRPVSEDLPVGARRRQQRGRKHARIGLEPRMDRVAAGGGGGHDVAHHVAAGGEGGEQRPVDRRDVGLQIPPTNAVEL